VLVWKPFSLTDASLYCGQVCFCLALWNRHLQCSLFFRYYAKFLSDCGKSGEAVKYILKAMQQLGLSLKNGSGKSHPELENHKFERLHRSLDKYCYSYKNAQRL